MMPFVKKKTLSFFELSLMKTIQIKTMMIFVISQTTFTCGVFAQQRQIVQRCCAECAQVYLSGRVLDNLHFGWFSMGPFI